MNKKTEIEKPYQEYKNTNNSTNILDDLEVGDILFCNSNTLTGNIIRKITNSKYSHVAIYLGDGKITHSTKKGVSTESLDSLINESNYIAITRQLDEWSLRRKKVLKIFTEEMQNTKYNYNFTSFFKAKYNEKNITKKLDTYFETPFKTREIPESVFCSQYILECLYKVGLIDDSFVIAYAPRTISPKDMIDYIPIGFHVGYIKHENILIDEDDDFWNKGKYYELVSK